MMGEEKISAPDATLTALDALRDQIENLLQRKAAILEERLAEAEAKMAPSAGAQTLDPWRKCPSLGRMRRLRYQILCETEGLITIYMVTTRGAESDEAPRVVTINSRRIPCHQWSGCWSRSRLPRSCYGSG